MTALPYLRDTRRASAFAALTLLCCSCSSGSTSDLNVTYGNASLMLRVGEATTSQPPNTSGATDLSFSVTPALPAGLTLDAATGVIHGTPSAVHGSQSFTITAKASDQIASATIELAIGGALPAAIATLESGFTAAEVARFATAPAKMAIAPDGRVFVTELATGVVRVIAADGVVLPTPFATVSILNGSHLGLLGITLSPTFATDGHVFAMACTPAGSGKPDRSIIYRWTDSSSLGTAQTILLDDLPVSMINNGGAMCFDAQGMLLVSVGDAEDPTLAQSDSSYAGKLLRIDPNDGSVPADNPDSSSHIFARGFRNTFALTMHPDVQTVFAADNGPTGNDELNLIFAGRNYEWGAPDGSSFGAQTGSILRTWADVVVPTGMAFADPNDAAVWPEQHERSLYLTFYEEEVVARFEMSGSQRADIDAETEFLRFVPDATDNKPLDVQLGPDGRLWVLTFAALYRIDRIR